MKIFLVNPNSYVIEKSWAYKKFCAPIAPMGIGYMAAVLQKDKFDVTVVDQFAAKMPESVLLERIKKERPRVIGFSALTTVVPDIKRMVKEIRTFDKECVIVLGNIHATCFPDELLNESCADVIVRGEGEMTMLELCRRVRNNDSMHGVMGVSFKSGTEVVHEPSRPLIEDLDSLPFPAWHLFELNHYSEAPLVAINRTPSFPIIASRGCPYRCYYCSQDKVYGKVRYRNPESVLDEIEYFNKNLGINYFGFSDAYFPYDEASGVEFCRRMMNRGLHKKIRWCTETRVDKVTPSLLRDMKKAGAHLIMYGIEVGNPKILKSLDKRTTLDDARYAVKSTREAGIFTLGLFMLGLPGETKKTCIDTINFAKSLNTDIAKFNIAVPYPGSRFFEDYRKKAFVDPLEKFTSWADWTNLEGDLVYTPDSIDSATLRNLQRRAMRSYYMRPLFMLSCMRRKVISFNNLFWGGIWLILLIFSGLAKKIKKMRRG